MRYGSVCSGIEAASVAWEPLGWQASFFSEIEAFPNAVLAHRFPHVPNWGDLTKYAEWPDANFDVLVGGTPCQSFSVAGLRAGLDDPRGNLTLVYLGVVARYRPRWILWENVPGVLSDRTNAFGQFLAGLSELGYGWAYRVLDAQHFGVPQRRRRVFVVGYLGDWRRAAAVLFEQQSLSWYPPPRRETGERIALPVTSRVDRGGEHREAEGNNLVVPPLRGNGPGSSRAGDSRGQDPLIVQALCADAHPGSYSGQDAYTGRLIAHALKADGFDASEDGTGRGTPLIAAPLTASYGKQVDSSDTSKGPPNLIASTLVSPGQQWNSEQSLPNLIAVDAYNGKIDGDVTATINSGIGKQNSAGAQVMGVNWQKTSMSTTLDKSTTPALLNASAVRRLTPRECERLQGFPDDYTLIPIGKRGKPAKDGPRYKALGNSMAVPVIRWIGERIAMANALSVHRASATQEEKE